MVKKVVTALVLFCAMNAGTASALQLHPLRLNPLERVSASMYFAHSFMPQVCWPINIIVDIPDGQIDPEVGGERLAYAYYGPNPEKCEIHLSQSLVHRSYMIVCSVMMHEFGHLVGLHHSDDPKDVMYPIVPVIEICLRPLSYWVTMAKKGVYL